MADTLSSGYVCPLPGADSNGFGKKRLTDRGTSFIIRPITLTNYHFNIKKWTEESYGEQAFTYTEGVRDIYSGECRRKLALESKILKVLYLYGYEHLETPSLEYFDIFNKDRGSVGDPGNVEVFRQR